MKPAQSNEARLHAYLAAHPRESFMRSALVQKLHLADAELGAALDTLEARQAIVRCRVQRPGRAPDEQVKVSMLGVERAPMSAYAERLAEAGRNGRAMAVARARGNQSRRNLAARARA